MEKANGVIKMRSVVVRLSNFIAENLKTREKRLGGTAAELGGSVADYGSSKPLVISGIERSCPYSVAFLPCQYTNREDPQALIRSVPMLCTRNIIRVPMHCKIHATHVLEHTFYN